jgi:hypothetical protein
MSEDAFLQAEAKRRGLTVTELLMLNATPDAVVRDLVADGRRGISQSQSLVAPERAERSEPVRRGNGEPRPLQQPPGISLIDAMCEAQDARDKAERGR